MTKTQRGRARRAAAARTRWARQKHQMKKAHDTPPTRTATDKPNSQKQVQSPGNGSQKISNRVRGLHRRDVSPHMPHQEGSLELPLGKAPGVAEAQIHGDDRPGGDLLRITVSLRDDILELFTAYRKSHSHLNPPDSLLAGALIARGLVSFYKAIGKASKAFDVAQRVALANLQETIKE